MEHTAAAAVLACLLTCAAAVLWALYVALHRLWTLIRRLRPIEPPRSPSPRAEDVVTPRTSPRRPRLLEQFTPASETTRRRRDRIISRMIARIPMGKLEVEVQEEPRATQRKRPQDTRPPLRRSRRLQ